MIKVFISTSTVLIVMILCNLSIFWQYINQTLLMLITNIIAVLALFIFLILALWHSDKGTTTLITFFITCVIVPFIALMNSYIPISQNDTSYWLVVNSPMITSIIFIVLFVVMVVVIVLQHGK